MGIRITFVTFNPIEDGLQILVERLQRDSALPTAEKQWEILLHRTSIKNSGFKDNISFLPNVMRFSNILINSLDLFQCLKSFAGYLG